MTARDRSTDQRDQRGEALFGWLAAAAVAAPVLAAVELGCIGSAFAAALSDTAGLSSLGAVVTGAHALLALPLAALASLIERRFTIALPRAGLLLGVATAASSGALAITRFSAYVAARDVRDFPERLAFAQTGASVALAGAGVVLGVVVFRVMQHVRSERAARLTLSALVAASASGLLAVAHSALAPIHMRAFALVCAVAALGAAMLVVRLWLPSRLHQPLAAVLCLLLLVPVLGPLGNLHARLVLFGHSAVAGTVAVGLRDAFDQDADGSPGVMLGGIDCDDADPRRAASEREIPGDGIDQDCRGGDAPAAPKKPEPAVLPDRCTLPTRPSILLVTIDAFRADYLTREITPYIARFATGGVQLERAYTAATLTLTSFPSLLSGRSCSAFSASNPAVDQRATLGPTLPRVLRDAGYRTVGLNYFETPQSLKGEFTAFNTAFLDPLPGQLRAGRRAASLTNAVLEITARTPEPWFVWVHYPDAHAPYLDPQTAEQSDAQRYAAELSYVDLHVGRLVAGLAARAALERTVIVITADHGEALGEGGHEGHGPNVLESTIQVPLLLLIPGCSPRRIDEPVSMTELASSLAALGGATLGGPGLFGARTTKPPVVSEAIMLPDGRLLRALILGTDKLVVDVRNGGRMAFDLARDPHELRNVYALDSARRERLEAAYQGWLDALPYL